jgi:hypothetical protein
MKEGKKGSEVEREVLPYYELGWRLNSYAQQCLKQRGCRGKREAGISGEATDLLD